MFQLLVELTKSVRVTTFITVLVNVVNKSNLEMHVDFYFII